MDILPFWSLLGTLLALCMDEIMGALQMDEGRAPPLQGRAEASWGLVPAHSMESTPPRGGEVSYSPLCGAMVGAQGQPHTG